MNLEYMFLVGVRGLIKTSVIKIIPAIKGKKTKSSLEFTGFSVYMNFI